MELDPATVLEHYLMEQHALGDPQPAALDELHNFVYWMEGHDREPKQARYTIALVDEWEWAL